LTINTVTPAPRWSRASLRSPPLSCFAAQQSEGRPRHPQPQAHNRSTAPTVIKPTSKAKAAPGTRNPRRSTVAPHLTRSSRRAKRSPPSTGRRRSFAWLSRGSARSAGVLEVRRAPNATEATPNGRDPSPSSYRGLRWTAALPRKPRCCSQGSFRRQRRWRRRPVSKGWSAGTCCPRP